MTANQSKIYEFLTINSLYYTYFFIDKLKLIIINIITQHFVLFQKNHFAFEKTTFRVFMSYRNLKT